MTSAIIVGIVIAGTAWLIVSGIVGVVLGRVIALRNRQVPRHSWPPARRPQRHRVPVKPHG